MVTMFLKFTTIKVTCVSAWRSVSLLFPDFSFNLHFIILTFLWGTITVASHRWSFQNRFCALSKFLWEGIQYFLFVLWNWANLGLSWYIISFFYCSVIWQKCVQVLSAVWVFQRLLPACTCGHAVCFQPEFRRLVVPGWGAVFHDPRCLESPLAAAVRRCDVTAWDSVTAPRSPTHSALGALLHLLGSAGSGTHGTPLSLLSSSFSQFPFSAEFHGEHGSSSLLVRCGVLLTVPHIFPLILQIPRED